MALLVATLIVMAAPTVARGERAEQPKLVVCALPAAMPRTGRDKGESPQGIDLAVAELVAGRLGRTLKVHWCTSYSCSWNCVSQRRCDVVLGQAEGSGPSRGVAWSAPYAGAQFGLVVSRASQGVRSLDDLRDKRIGIVAGTVALSEQEYTVVGFKSREEVLDGFETQRLDGALIDADFAAWYLHSHPALPLRLVDEFVPREHWNMAMAVRAEDSNLLAAINRALTELSASGELREAYAEYGVPRRAPFTRSVRNDVAYDSWKKIVERGEIVVSMDPANLPFSAAKGDLPGFDVEIARALAEQLGLKLRMRWIDVHRETAIGELLDRECDFAMGAAVDPNAVDDEEELTGKVVYSTPYYGTGYVLVVRKNGPSARSLSDLKGEKSKRIGAEAGSVADYKLRQQGYLRRLFRTQLSALNALNQGDIDYAYLWANAGWTLHATPEFELELAPDYVPEDKWNIAIAMRPGDDELKQHVDAAIKKLVDDGLLSRTMAKYHVPCFPVTPADAARASSAAPIHHPATDRGLEPQMSRRQRSKQGYGGLDRIRSTGVLVVGLDQNNLPFSTAHPEPAGLDYEIAGLLAEQLGVKLDVYWAYSSHDSYPSKLASKKLCDIVLGVMPDDRFGHRVSYSKPYYSADYQLVVPSDADVPDDLKQLLNGPLAVEAGVVVRGVDQQQHKTYPSLEAVLAAVADKKQPAGYVISTRGNWLAGKQQSGKLKFVDIPQSPDKFPICVAVRKNEGDLRDAVDSALDELARSGRLAAVFARWHMPYLASGKPERPSEQE
jgi:polar amino acid transport system substrate-binding protein